MGKTITKVIRVDNDTKKLMNEFYKDMKRDKTPPYAVFQADTGDTIVTLYESGKAMFQGVSADIEAGMWESIRKDKDNIDYFMDTKDTKIKKEEQVDIPSDIASVSYLKNNKVALVLDDESKLLEIDITKTYLLLSSSSKVLILV